VGESQLLQNEGSVLDTSSSGKLERDQQGTSNLYNYNYWSSPVSAININSNNTPYSIDDVLKDGTNSSSPQDLQWTNAHNAIGTTVPITMSNRWLYAYENYPEDSYASWRALTEEDNLSTGLGFTMKGSGAGDPVDDVQNYVFVGKPNNGTIITPVTIGNQALVGNPYASAIDAEQFIKDNLPGVVANSGSTQSIDGTLYFWEHYTSNFTHVLEDYEGGYATYNLSGGNPAVSPPLVSENGVPTKLPGQYIPVGQGFFVTSSNTGGSIQFKNSQRQFVRENVSNSQFIRSAGTTTYQENSISEIQRVRIDFKTPEGAKRPLLLAFTADNQASDGFDFGYDAENADASFANDMFWEIENKDFSTQGVGEFNESSQYPLNVYISTTGTYEIALNSIENFENQIDVFVFDSITNNYFNISNDVFQITLDANNYLNRFYVTFSEENTLSNTDFTQNQFIINFLETSQEIYVKSMNISNVKRVRLINLLGQEIHSWKNIKDFFFDSAIKIPVKNLSSGTYIVKVETLNFTHNKKIIIKN
uniref:T9SS type A sorting domain-containing protein n=1 Tax=Psychroserpens mesophilus TaxID=325473 RepID=UPI003F49240A